ncbi:MAG: hypothetical protein JSV62_08040 [Promethearchaeota archaeon]|nr:MAG: hypothetical protein JSV62_08040 [Candidatus Lokiarchaeota archaeon]
MSNFDREPNNSYCLCLIFGCIIAFSLIWLSPWFFNFLLYFMLSFVFLVPGVIGVLDAPTLIFISLVGFIVIIIGIVSLLQKGKSGISDKRVICPSCKITLESLEKIGTYQCPECKKKFKTKLNHITSTTGALVSSRRVIFYQKKKEK